MYGELCALYIDYATCVGWVCKMIHAVSKNSTVKRCCLALCSPGEKQYTVGYVSAYQNT